MSHSPTPPRVNVNVHLSTNVDNGTEHVMQTVRRVSRTRNLGLTSDNHYSIMQRVVSARMDEGVGWQGLGGW